MHFTVLMYICHRCPLTAENHIIKRYLTERVWFLKENEDINIDYDAVTENDLDYLTVRKIASLPFYSEYE